MRTPSITLALVVAALSCKPAAESTLATDMASSSDSIELAFSQPIEPSVAKLFNAITNNHVLSENDIEQAAGGMNTIMTARVQFKKPIPPGAGRRVQSRMQSEGGYNHDSDFDTYRGLVVGSRVIIFKLYNQPTDDRVDKWRVFSWVSHSLLNDHQNGKYTSAEEQVRYALDSKIYERRRIKHQRDLAEQSDFAASFLPGYSGAQRAFYGDSTSERLLGVVQVIGDAATFGLGSKITLVRKTAAVVVLTASSVRVSAAGNRFARGEANFSTGVDAFLATVEAALAGVTTIKLRLSSARAWVANADEAAMMGRQLGRSADDILENGISKRELESALGDLPELRRLDDRADSLRGANDAEDALSARRIAENSGDTLSAGRYAGEGPGALSKRLNGPGCPAVLGLAGRVDCYADALRHAEQVINARGEAVEGYFRFTNYNKAMEAAMAWLKKNGSGTVEGKWQIGKLSENFGYTRPNELVGVAANGSNFKLRIESHSLRQVDNIIEAHINVSIGKTDGPHFLFSGTNSEVQAILRQLFP